MKNTCYNNLTNSFTIHEMYDCECTTSKKMDILDSLIEYRKSLLNTNLKEKKPILQFSNQKMVFF